MSDEKPTNAEPLLTQEGAVAFFDILGYTQFLKNNEPESAAYQVLDTIAGIEKRITALMHERVGKYLYSATDEKELSGRTRWLVFSDTIVVVIAFPSAPDFSKRMACLAHLMIIASFLWNAMWDFGLPLRGAITKGKFAVNSSCFAGKPLIEAYELASALDCSGVAISDTVAEWLKEDRKYWPISGELHFEYLVPYKSAQRRGFMLYPMVSAKTDTDLREFVHEAFWKHNKHIGPGVPEKIENTERLLRFMKFKFRDDFSRY